MSAQLTPVAGTANGVPFLALPPVTARPDAPIVVAWHLMDPPCTERAFAAAMPLDGLDAWRIYLGLPLSGSRMPAGGPDEIMRLGYEDAVLNLHGPVAMQAAEEFPAALAELRTRFGLSGGSVTPIRLVVGADDDPMGIVEPARRLHEVLPGSDLVMVDGMAHNLAEAPGLEPAPQIPAAATADQLAVEWLQRHSGGES